MLIITVTRPLASSIVLTSPSKLSKLPSFTLTLSPVANLMSSFGVSLRMEENPIQAESSSPLGRPPNRPLGDARRWLLGDVGIAFGCSFLRSFGLRDLFLNGRFVRYLVRLTRFGALGGVRHPDTLL